MSGTVCEIIIRGNFTQSYATTLASAHPHNMELVRAANNACAIAQSLCSLGTTVYDGVEVMSDAQQEQATVIMGEFNTIATELLQEGSWSATDATNALRNFNIAGDALLADVAPGAL